MQQPLPWAAHLTRGVDYSGCTYCMLRWPWDSRAHTSKENVLALKTNKKREHNFDSRKGKKEGGKKEGRQEERNKGLVPKCCFPPFQFTHVTFNELQVPRNLQVLVSRCCGHRAVYCADLSRNTLQTPCNYVQYMCTVQMISTCCIDHSTCIFDLRKDAK